MFCGLAPITGVEQVQVKHLLREGLSPNLDFHRILKIFGKINFDANMMLWAGIKKFLRLLGDDFAKDLDNSLNEMPTRQG